MLKSSTPMETCHHGERYVHFIFIPVLICSKTTSNINFSLYPYYVICAGTRPAESSQRSQLYGGKLSKDRQVY